MPVIATVVVALLLVGVGFAAERIVLRPSKPDMAAAVYALAAGWALMTLVAVTCALVRHGLFVPMALMGIIGAIGLLIALRRLAIGLLAFAWLLIFPLLVIAATIPPTMFDEFSHWLPNARFLVERNHFPD